MPHKRTERELRQFTAISLGAHIEGLAPLIPATNSTDNWIYGVRRRVGLRVDADQHLDFRSLRSFQRVFNHQNFTPLPRDTDYRLDPYLAESHLPEHRKEEYRQAWKPLAYFWKHQYLLNCKNFMKTEVLDRKAKHKKEQMPPVRIINSRSDSFKAATGPYFHRIEHSIFSSKYFIKYVPVRDRMRWLIQRLEKSGRIYLSTDFTAFESHMTPGVMQNMEFQLYAHMLKFAPKRDQILRLMNTIRKKNRSRSKFGSFTIDGVRMSGDMCTSLGNGYTNMILMFHTLSQRGIPLSMLDGVFEGDDGLISVPVKYRHLIPTEKDFEAMGCHVKLKLAASVSESEFCGIVCDPDVGDNIIDAYGVLVKFGWTMSSQRYGGDKKLMGLLRAKAFSLAYEAPGCPITRALADAMLRLTTGYQPIFDYTWWDYQVLQGIDEGKLPPPPIVHFKSRVVMAEKFGVDIPTQLRYEQFFASMRSVCPLPNYFNEDLVAKSHVDMWDRNCLVIKPFTNMKIYLV